MIDICFLLFWLIIQKYKFALLPLTALLFCHSQIHTYFPINFHTRNVPEGSFKVLSYNIMGFNGAVKKEGENPILNYLKESGADILCLQEYQTIESPRYLRQKDVENALKDYPYHRIHTVGKGKNHSNRIACYSKFPILTAHELDYASERIKAMLDATGQVPPLDKGTFHAQLPLPSNTTFGVSYRPSKRWELAWTSSL